jgi:histidine ammonia-lyase
MAMDEYRLDGSSLDLDKLFSITQGECRVLLDEGAVRRMRSSRSVVEACVEERLVRYGITTGFGKFCDIVISREDNATFKGISS